MNKFYSKNSVFGISKIKHLYFYFCLIFLVQASIGQTTIFQFDFENSVNANINNSAGTPVIYQSGVNNIGLVNRNSCGNGTSSALQGNNWNTNNFYLITVNTTGFSNMTFSYCNSTSNTNINNFDIRYSLDFGTTTTSIVPTYVPSTGGGTNSAVLPATTNNQSEVWIYIYKSNNTSNNNTYLYVDNITLVGCPTTAISAQSSATQTQCLGSAFTPITVTATGAGLTYQWYSNASNSNSGGTSLGTANGAKTNSYTPQSTVAGTLYYYCIVTGTCGNATSAVSGAFITNASPTVPTVGTKTHPDCVTPTGSVVLSGLPASGTINQTGTVSNSYAITGTTMTISGLSAGTYQFSASNGSCPSSATGNVVINPVVTNTWTTSWSNGTPTSSQMLVFDGNYSSSADVVGCSCQVNTGKNVVFNSDIANNTGHTLTITNQVQVLGTGTLTFEDKASLVQVNNTLSIPNSGIITYKRETTPVSNFDYTYWSSPVASQILYDVSPLTLLDKFYSFNSGINNWQQESVSGAMAVGKGYIIRGPQTHMAPAPPSPDVVSFMGAPNNGILTTPIGVPGNINLIGNPYPSALDADSFIIANAGVIDGTLYFWTHNTNIGIGVSNPGSGSYAYSSDDYASYNLTGGVATQTPAISVGPNSNAPSGKIASGQAFFTTSVAAGNAIFNNNMRVGVGGITGNNSQFFKMASTSKTKTAIEKNRLWLNLSNNQGAFKQTLVGYITGATNDYERAYDGETFDSNPYLDFYSVNNDKKLTIQGRSLPFIDTDEVPLGYSSKIAGEFKIAIGQIDGVLVNMNVYLKDKILNIIHDLKTKPYVFTTETGDFNERFILQYANKTLATENFDVVESGVIISTKNKEIQIKSSDESIDKVLVYDFTGKVIYTKTNVADIMYKISNLNVGDKALIVKVILQNGQTVNKKIIY